MAGKIYSTDAEYFEAAYRANEQRKHCASALSNLGILLVAASAGRWFAGTTDLYTALWFGGGALLIALSLLPLSLLQAEV